MDRDVNGAINISSEEFEALLGLSICEGTSIGAYPLLRGESLLTVARKSAVALSGACVRDFLPNLNSSLKTLKFGVGGM